MDWKSVHGLQLALHLSEGSEIKGQIFDRLDTDDLKGEVGWTTVIELLKQHYEKMIIPLRLKPGKNLKIFVIKMDKLLMIILCVMKNKS